MRLLTPLAVLLLLATPAWAQGDSLRLAGVEIIREDVADSSEHGLLAEGANALHWKTREWVVRRELLLDSGRIYDPALAAETARNLRSLGIFRRVELDTVRTPQGLVLRVVTRDGWSAQPIFDINAAAGQTAFSLGGKDDNFLGLAAYGAIRYRETPDRSSWLFQYRQPRLIAETHDAFVGVECQHLTDAAQAVAGGVVGVQQVLHVGAAQIRIRHDAAQTR